MYKYKSDFTINLKDKKAVALKISVTAFLEALEERKSLINQKGSMTLRYYLEQLFLSFFF